MSTEIHSRLASSVSRAKSFNVELPAPQARQRSSYAFPADYVWGVSTAAYQVEGAANEDGRGPSIWDVFSHTPGKVKNNDNADITCDQYHRFKEDIQLMKQIGLNAYRFSVSWPRVLPSGDGAINQKGLDYYNRLVDELLANGIEPWITLFHWDLPQAMQDRFGGWQSRQTSEAFGHYAATVTRSLSDRVTNFFTVNEISCYTDFGYHMGFHAPGLQLDRKGRNQVRHHALLGHGLAVQAIRANANRRPHIGVAENPHNCVPIIETDAHIVAARKAMGDMNAGFLTAIMEGRYRDSYLQSEGESAPDFTESEMRTIGTPLDFVGINLYFPTYIRADDSDRGYSIVDMPKAYPTMDADWLKIGPQIAYWSPRHVHELWSPASIYITENGCCCNDELAADGEVYDLDRVMYVRNHLIATHRAIAEGVPLKGYFLWSLLDNFEWADGFRYRFGITHVDYKTLKRTPKLSSKFYAEVIQRSAVV